MKKHGEHENAMPYPIRVVGLAFYILMLRKMVKKQDRKVRFWVLFDRCMGWCKYLKGLERASQALYSEIVKG
jgi:hypothetical protein